MDLHSYMFVKNVRDFFPVIMSFVSANLSMYSPELISRPHFMITLCVNIFRIYKKLFPKIAMYPLSQKVPIDNKVLFLRPGKICTSLAFLVSAVFGNSDLEVKFIISRLAFSLVVEH